MSYYEEYEIAREERDDARATAVALEGELAHMQTGIDQVVRSVTADPCECSPMDPDVVCERCLRLAWLTLPSLVEMDALGQRGG